MTDNAAVDKFRPVAWKDTRREARRHLSKDAIVRRGSLQMLWKEGEKEEEKKRRLHKIWRDQDEEKKKSKRCWGLPRMRHCLLTTKSISSHKTCDQTDENLC